MTIFYLGDLKDVNIGQQVLVARCGSGRSYFGEFGTVTKFLEKHIVITTESGTIVKTDYCFNTVGKANKAGYFASLNVKNREDMIPYKVSYWNEKKLCFEYK